MKKADISMINIIHRKYRGLQFTNPSIATFLRFSCKIAIAVLVLLYSTVALSQYDNLKWDSYIDAKVQIAPSYLFITAFDRYFALTPHYLHKRAFDIGSGSGNEDI